MAMVQLKASEIFILFGVAATVHILGNLLNLPLLQLTTKPLLMPLLAAALIAAGNMQSQHKKILLAGIIFSWLGDVLLMFDYKGSGYFIGGLASFLCAHMMYIVYFLKARGPQPSLLTTKPWLIVAVLAYTIGLLVLLYPVLGAMRLPVLLYAGVIAAMLLCSIHAFTRLPLRAAGLFVTGAAFFVLSDSLLAINRFYKPFPFAGTSIMLTYCMAQFCIVKGSVIRSRAI
jgi:uncharacterized membrane protein YhhN